jgi:two-component system, sensor histidine kinase PdtaS
MAGWASQFDRWPTGTKLLLILSAALLPLGLALAWAAQNSLNDANRANLAAAEEQGRAAARAIESLIARNTLALRIAANGAFRRKSTNPCLEAAQSMVLTPAIGSRFVIRRPDASVICTHGDIQPQANDTIVAPGDVRLWVSPSQNRIDFRVGVVGGMATGELNAEELRAGAEEVAVSD